MVKSLATIAYSLLWASLLTALSSAVAIAAAPGDLGEKTDDATIAEIEARTRQAILKCIELERYSLNYRQNVAIQGRWKALRYFCSQETNNSLGLAGACVGTLERGKNITSFQNLNRTVLERGNILGMTGGIIGASGSSIELTVNAFHDFQAHARGFSPRAARETVAALSGEINALLEQRRSLIQSLHASGNSESYCVLANSESKVLQDIRDLSLAEFVRFNASARRQIAFQQSFYLTDTARNVAGSIGCRFGWAALRYGNRHNNTTAGIFNTISGALTILNPMVSRGIGILEARHQMHYMQRLGPAGLEFNSDKLKTDAAEMRSACQASTSHLAEASVQRSALYAQCMESVDREVELSQREGTAGFHIAAQNIAAGSFVGGTKVANGTLFLVAGIKYRRSSRLTNEYLATANITNLAGSSVATLDTLRLLVTRELDNRKLSKQHLLSGQIISERLRHLDEIEARVKSAGSVE